MAMTINQGNFHFLFSFHALFQDLDLVIGDASTGLIIKVYFISIKIKMDIPHISLMVDYLPSLQLKSVFSQEESFDALTASTFSNVNPPLWMVFSGNVIRPDFY